METFKALTPVIIGVGATLLALTILVLNDIEHKVPRAKRPLVFAVGNSIPVVYVAGVFCLLTELGPQVRETHGLIYWISLLGIALVFVSSWMEVSSTGRFWGSRRIPPELVDQPLKKRMWWLAAALVPMISSGLYYLSAMLRH